MATRLVIPTVDVGPGIKPASGAKMFFFQTGTSTDRDTFSDSGATIKNSNPVIADSNGVFPDIFIDGIYKVRLTDKNGVQTGFGEKDPVGPDTIFSIAKKPTESVTLTASQTTVTFTSINVKKAEIFLTSLSGDRGRLFEGTDFTVTSTTVIELTNSQPAGTICFADETLLEIAVSSDSDLVKKFATLALAIADPKLEKDDALNIAERSLGTEGGAMWDAVLLSSVTVSTGAPAAGNIVASTGVPALALSLRLDGARNVRQFGAKADGTDDAIAIQSAYDSIVSVGHVHYPAGTYLKTTPTTFTNKAILTTGDGASASIIKCSSSNGYTITNTTLPDKERVEFEYLGFETDQNGVHTGIVFNGESTTALGGQLSVDHCSFSGISNATAWKLGVSLDSGKFSDITYTFFRGNTSDRSKMTSAIQCGNSTDCKFIGNFYYWADVAVNISGFSEGITVRDSHMVPVNVGVRHQGTGNLVWVIDNHISGNIGGVTLGTTSVNAVNHCHVRGNLIFKDAASTDNFIAITVNSEKAEISGNETLIPGGTAAGGTQRGIVLGADSKRCRVYGNQLANMDDGILLTSGGVKNTVTGNTFLLNTNDVVDNAIETVKVGNQSGNSNRGAVVKLNANESIPNNTVTIIDWDAAEIDTNASFMLGNPSRLTVPTGVSQVRVFSNIKWATDSVGDRVIEVLKNGVAAAAIGLGSDRRTATVQADASISSSTLNVVAGDFFEIRVFQTSGGALDVVTGGNTWFEMEII